MYASAADACAAPPVARPAAACAPLWPQANALPECPAGRKALPVDIGQVAGPVHAEQGSFMALCRLGGVGVTVATRMPSTGVCTGRARQRGYRGLHACNSAAQRQSKQLAVAGEGADFREDGILSGMHVCLNNMR
jgi:hypothetical protein